MPSHNVLLTLAQRKVVADLLPKFADRTKLDMKKSRTDWITTKEPNDNSDGRYGA